VGASNPARVVSVQVSPANALAVVLVSLRAPAVCTLRESG